MRHLVEINDIWVAYGEDGEKLRRLRILAPHPDGGWIYEELPSKMIKHSAGSIGKIPQWNLTYVFRREE